MMTNIIHLSDFHFGLGKTEDNRTSRIFSWIAKNYPTTPVLITGDLTDSATAGQMRGMRRELDILARTNPVLMVPGNHDYAWKGLELRKNGWRNWVNNLGSPLGWNKPPVLWMGKDYEPIGVDGLGVWNDQDIVYFGIDSGDPDDREGSARGFISRGLAAALKERLEHYSGKVRVAILHHHPFDDDYFMKLNGADHLMEALSGRCEILLFGHQHHYGLWLNRDGIPLIVASHKSTARLSGSCVGVTIIGINTDGGSVSLTHRIELVP